MLGLLLLTIVIIFILGLVLRTKAAPVSKRHPVSTVKLAVFLGSGGHTSEALSLLSGIDFERYTPRVYIVSEGDTLSIEKAQAMELKRGAEKDQYTFMTVPRARKVLQPLLTTPFTALVSFLACFRRVTIPALFESKPFADVLIVNGPGTCFILCLAVHLNKILRLRAPRTIYIESFARVNRLSISGKLLRYIADRFIVQWPTLLKDGKRGECHGWLV